MFDETQINDEQSFPDALTTPSILRDKMGKPLTTAAFNHIRLQWRYPLATPGRSSDPWRNPPTWWSSGRKYFDDSSNSTRHALKTIHNHYFKRMLLLYQHHDTTLYGLHEGIFTGASHIAVPMTNLLLGGHVKRDKECRQRLRQRRRTRIYKILRNVC